MYLLRKCSNSIQRLCIFSTRQQHAITNYFKIIIICLLFVVMGTHTTYQCNFSLPSECTIVCLCLCVVCVLGGSIIMSFLHFNSTNRFTLFSLDLSMHFSVRKLFVTCTIINYFLYLFYNTHKTRIRHNLSHNLA